MSFIKSFWIALEQRLIPKRIARGRIQRHPLRLEALEVRTLLSGGANIAPVVMPVQFLIGENSVHNAFVGDIVATDLDPGQTKTFSIAAGNTDNAFAIDATTGVLTVNNSAALDFETRSQFDLTVRVDDNDTPAQFGTTAVTVFLRDENDAPVVQNSEFLIGENSANNAFIGTVPRRIRIPVKPGRTRLWREIPTTRLPSIPQPAC